MERISMRKSVQQCSHLTDANKEATNTSKMESFRLVSNSLNNFILFFCIR
jgi:hypothetical protein